MRSFCNDSRMHIVVGEATLNPDLEKRRKSRNIHKTSPMLRMSRYIMVEVLHKFM